MPPADIPEMLWFEEETELIKGCAALSSALGLHKSFSTSDISQLPSPPEEHPLRAAVSDLALSWVQRYGYVVGGGRLEAASRSCSTWVAVGDAASQLPSPHPHHLPLAPPQPAFTPADLVRSVNKKVRQNYIRRRLLTTCRALERLSQSEFDLDRLGAAVAAAAAAASRNEEEDDEEAAASASKRGGHHLSLTLTDVERQRGKPLSKYDRNMMIFNWLHTLDDQPPLPPP
ncbi:hypothetical protein AAG570_005458 [Ranatra chinensis]|uniref:Uncharacterized protein n=1 Tax=Ranatra chinensis TaxID=642074 RepID=A0ABD0YCH9_9HEMI